MTLAANALITLAEAKDYIFGEQDSSVPDPIVEMLINSVSTRFESRCRREFKSATDATLYLDGNGEKELSLPRSPVTSIASVTEDDTVLTEGDDEDYRLYTSDNDAYLYRLGTTWLKGAKKILLTTFLAGFVTVPADLKLACMEQTAFEYQKHQKREWGETSRSFEGGSVSLTSDGLLQSVEDVLQHYEYMK